MKSILASAITALLAIASAHAEGVITGNDVHTLCRSRSDDLSRNMSVTFFVGAVLDMHSLTKTRGFPQTYCDVEGVSVRQAIDVTCRYLDARPESRQKAAVALTLTALREAFPCEAPPHGAK